MSEAARRQEEVQLPGVEITLDIVRAADPEAGLKSETSKPISEKSLVSGLNGAVNEVPPMNNVRMSPEQRIQRIRIEAILKRIAEEAKRNSDDPFDTYHTYFKSVGRRDVTGDIKMDALKPEFPEGDFDQAEAV